MICNLHSNIIYWKWAMVLFFPLFFSCEVLVPVLSIGVPHLSFSICDLGMKVNTSILSVRHLVLSIQLSHKLLCICFKLVSYMLPPNPWGDCGLFYSVWLNEVSRTENFNSQLKFFRLLLHETSELKCSMVSLENFIFTWPLCSIKSATIIWLWIT